jgi:DNA-binding NarL/FixJ family response regulator
MPRTVILADDHDVMRQTLESFMETSGYRVLSSTDHGGNVVDLVERHEPDLLILDLNMPRRGGLDILDDLAHTDDPPRVIVLTTHDEPAYVEIALSRGASAYVLKGRSVRELSDALAAVEAGKRYLSPSVAASPADAARLTGFANLAAQE